ncbi:agrin, partial [Aplysia californica]|uniref:Agrin n=1 Tax=Aplysia californica TaxID=6500 RepID=A0ABM1A6P8_APLCA
MSPHPYPSMADLRVVVLFVSALLCAYSASADDETKRLWNCHDKGINDRTDMAMVVVSGTVKKLMSDELHSTNEIRMFRGEVEIKRIFKGGQVVDTLATITPGLLRQHKMVMVEGFGDPEICDNVVKERDTKIFMLSPNGNGELKLNSSVVPLTLHNLDYVDSVVNHLPFITEKPKQISPCYLYFCPFGATCRVDEETMTPMCVCERKCSKIFAPVCGTDMVTYSNLCMLERASCIHNKLIKVKSHGVCGVRDPCEGHVCKFGAECLPSQDGERARC